jgi:HD superfamily phosphohydrolase
MNLLRIVASMAWSDGCLATEEMNLMLDRFSAMFAADAPQQQALRQELQDYLTQNIPLEELTPQLQSDAERELVLRLGYEVIASSARTPEEAAINPAEAEAYQNLKQLLGLPDEAVRRIESEVGEPGDRPEGLVESLSSQLEQFFQG